MAEPFKNFFNKPLVQLLAYHILRHYPKFKSQSFCDSALYQFDDLALKERSQQITSALIQFMPSDFERSAKILVDCLHPEESVPIQQHYANQQGLRGWIVMPMADFIARQGLLDVPVSLWALAEMTKRFSAEFAIRPFIIQNLQAVLPYLQQWALSSNEHLRRLASEGSRPKLPWGQHLPQLIADPTPLFPILTQLRDDPSEYVRRSVANHLNDISKDHPQHLLDITQKWLQDAPSERKQLLKHACRTLIKRGDVNILAAFGYASGRQIRRSIAVTDFEMTPKQVKVPNYLSWSLMLQNNSTQVQSLVVDYIIHWRLNNGLLSPKVYKWKSLSLKAHQAINIHKSHHFKWISTRTYYAGAHEIEIQINGIKWCSLGFQLVL